MYYYFDNIFRFCSPPSRRILSFRTISSVLPHGMCSKKALLPLDPFCLRANVCLFRLLQQLSYLLPARSNQSTYLVPSDWCPTIQLALGLHTAKIKNAMLVPRYQYLGKYVSPLCWLRCKSPSQFARVEHSQWLGRDSGESKLGKGQASRVCNGCPA